MKRIRAFLFILMTCACVFLSADAFAKKKTCPPLSQRYDEIKQCLLCPVFEVVLKTDQTMSTMSYNSLAAGFRNVIIIVMALFIAYHTLISVSAFTKQDVGKYLQTIAVQAFKVLVAAILLSDSKYVYDFIINPLMQAGLEFGLTIINPQTAASLKEYVSSILAQNQIPSGVISQNLLAQVLGTIQLFSKSSAELPAIGSALICVSKTTASWKNIIPDISMMIEGIVVYAFGWAIALACCFYLLDSVVRFGIFCTLLPFLVACWPFKITAKYLKAGWDIFMNVFFNFVMMGLIISLTSELSSAALTGGNKSKAELENILEYMNKNDIEDLKDLMDLSGTKFLVLLACCIFAFKLVAQVGELANAISGTSGPTSKDSIGGHIGGLAAQAAQKAGTASLKAAGKVSGVTGAIQGMKDRIANRSDNIRKNVAGVNKSGGNGNNNGGDGNNADDNGSA
ncbi:MAG: hypothetical protein J6039_04195 [Alphaproteobacteria bacterium]|nr:hypothetical protein [Alphaproteobacteria bacterium]